MPPPSDLVLVLPALEVARGSTRAHVPGFALDYRDGDVRVYARDEVAEGLDRTPRSGDYCVARRRA